MPNLCIAILQLAPLTAGLLPEESVDKRARTLVLCLDGINFEDFEFMQRRGHFGYLGRPARLIAPFPSLTNPSMVQILESAGSPPSPGYEDRFFDWSVNRVRGGILKRLGPGFVKGTFRELFDFHPPGVQSGFEYLAPPMREAGRWTCSSTYGPPTRSLAAEQSLGFLAVSTVDPPPYLQTAQAAELLYAMGF